MWKDYANPNGIVLAVDDSIMPASPLVRLTHCVYANSTTDEKLVNIFRDEYCMMGYGFLIGLNKNVAFNLLENHPQAFVKLIAMGLLCYIAPRIKSSANYSIEDETRAILSIPTPHWNKQVEGHDDIIEKLSFLPSILKKYIAEEYSRNKRDGSVSYYRELKLPINLLCGVYVKERDTEECVKAILRELNLNIPINRNIIGNN